METREKTQNRILIAAPRSGSGKTLVTCGILHYLKAQGLSPVSLKCGPDYIDPMFHKTVLGVESGNLDSYFMDADTLRRTMAEAEGDCVCIEGVMGLYDGVSPDGIAGSSYEAASLTKTPVLLLVDAKGAGRTLLSMVRGILEEDENHLIGGILFNRMSERFYAKIAPVAEREWRQAGFDVKLLGFLPELADVRIESRYLGLQLPEEVRGLSEQIKTVSEALSAHCDMPAMLEMMSGAVPLHAECMRIRDAAPSDQPILAVAYDSAFCFYYRENFALLRACGARIVFFSPLSDTGLPEGAAGLLLGGGYPELYAAKLSANKEMLHSIQGAVSSGMPVLAECGGFLYLHESLKDSTGKVYPMAGVVKGSCYPAGRSVRFGYCEVVNGRSEEDQFLIGLKGHEFHYYESTAPGDRCILRKTSSGEQQSALGGAGCQLWGFPHFYYPSHPAFAEHFVKKMKEYSNTRPV
ncbi:MAG: cobyrinate a,c-diamide synthase [Lachnospiraceae bacterium]|nr:cobyrinate a,c-diamide synthase [Lachnospiraceae bacterium]